MRTIARAIQDTCDAAWAQYYHRVLLLLLSALVVFTGIRGYKLTMDWDQWTVGEWLISYSGGFVRRGLSGQLLLIVNRLAGTPINLLVFITTVGIFACFCLLFAALLLPRRITLWYLLLCLSPAFLLFTFYNPNAIGRQEILVYLAFVVWGSLLTRRGSPRPLAYLGFASFCFLSTLVHELFFLFTPYFVLLWFVLFRIRWTRCDWKLALIAPASSGAAMLAILLFSGRLDEVALCASVVRAGAPARVCNGILAYGDPGIGPVLMDFIGHFDGHTLISLVVIFPIVLLAAWVFVATHATDAIAPRTLLVAWCGCILFSGPLFALAVDWGRWISIHTVLVTITCTYFLSDRNQGYSARIERPGARAAHLLLGCAAIATTVCWSVNYCCGPDFFEPLGPVRMVADALK
jgi:hypothetical protein